MNENVKIPLWLMKRTIQLLECFDIPESDVRLHLKYHAVMTAFREKEQRLALRESYADIVFAEDEDKRAAAKSRYIQEKQTLYSKA